METGNSNNNHNNGRHQQQQQGQHPPAPPPAPPPMEPEIKCMTVCHEAKRIAFACYDEERNEIIIEESPVDIHDNVESLVQGFVSVTRPNLILISAKIAADGRFLDLLTRPAPGSLVREEEESSSRRVATAANDGNHQQGGQLGGNENGNNNNAASNREEQGMSPDSPGQIPYRLLKSSAFDLKNCKNLILTKLRVMTLMHQESQRTNSSSSSRSNHQNLYGGGQFQQPSSFHTNGTTTTTAALPALRYNALASIINFESSAQIKALGSLISFLQNTIFRLEEGSTVTINTISYAQSSQYMQIDEATLNALHIFNTEHHPLNIAKGHGKEKEGYSIFTLLDRTRSKMGRQCLRNWMLKPLLDIHAIKERHNGVELFLKPEITSNVNVVLGLLQQIGSIDKIILRMQKCHSVPMDFLTLSSTLSASIGICTTLQDQIRDVLWQQLNSIENNGSGASRGGGTAHSSRSHLTSSGNHNNNNNEDAERIKHAQICDEIRVLDNLLSRCHVPVLKELHERITSIVDSESTAELKESVVIHFGFHEELDNAKEAFDTLDETLSAVGSQVLEKHPELEQLKVVFIPQVGFLISIDKRNTTHDIASNKFPDLPPDFDFVFIQNNDAFFKNPHVRQLDDDIGDLDAFIKDTESMIVSELEVDILDCETEIRSTFEALAELDCILSFANCAADLNFVRPEMIDVRGRQGGAGGGQNYLIDNGRHPLQELIIDGDFIANDTIVDVEKRVNIVTGPNFSGKSCYTRQVGVLVYLAHIGCFLPCDSARISITDRILARISCVETCAVPQSSFQLDLTQMATILRRSTASTLVLIDEFGKGTAPVSGIAVLTSALKKLSTIGCTVMCTTHFLEMFSLGLLVDGCNGIKVLQMAVHVPDSEEDNAIPLFKLEEGVAKSSAGLICAKMAGVNRDIIHRANDILNALKNGQPVKPIAMANTISNSALGTSERRALRVFFGAESWSNATDNELGSLIQCFDTL